MRKPKAFLVGSTEDLLTYEYRGHEYTVDRKRSKAEQHAREQDIIDRKLDTETRVMDIEREILECRRKFGWN